MTRERLAYLHVPKAAGTSVRAVLEEAYPADQTAPWFFEPGTFRPPDVAAQLTRAVHLGPPEELSQYRFLAGHFTLPTLLVSFDAADIACVLREPRARLLSHYTFWRSWDDEMFERWAPYEAPAAAQEPLSSFLARDDVAHQSDNLLTRLLLGRHSLIPDDHHIAASDVDELTALAIEALDGIGHVDLVERGADMRRDLGAFAGVELSGKRRNETDLRAGPPVDLDDLASAATLDLLHDRTEIDRRLWHHVAQRFGWGPEQIDRAAGTSFAGSLARLASAAADRAATTHADELASVQDRLDAFEQSQLVRMATPLWGAKAAVGRRLASWRGRADR